MKTVTLFITIFLISISSYATDIFSYHSEEYMRLTDVINSCYKGTTSGKQTASTLDSLYDLRYTKDVKYALSRYDVTKVIAQGEQYLKQNNLWRDLNLSQRFVKVKTVDYLPVFALTKKFKIGNRLEDMKFLKAATGFEGSESWMTTKILDKTLGLDLKMYSVGLQNAIKMLMDDDVQLVILTAGKEFITQLPPSIKDEIKILQIKNKKLNSLYANYSYNSTTTIAVEYFIAGINFRYHKGEGQYRKVFRNRYKAVHDCLPDTGGSGIRIPDGYKSWALANWF